MIFHCNNCDVNRAFVTITSSRIPNAKFTFKGTSPPIIFARIVRSMNALQMPYSFVADSFHTKKLSRLYSSEVRFQTKIGRFAFSSPPLGEGLRDNVWCSFWAHWKARSGHPISVNFLLLLTFFARCYGWVATSEKRSNVGDFAPMRSVWSEIFRYKGSPSTNHFCTDS